MTSQFADFGIHIPEGASGEVRTLCPECSANRRKSNERCLAVNVGKGTWLCHHCGHVGGLRFRGRTPVAGPSALGKAVPRPAYRALEEIPVEVVKWFRARGIPEDILKANRIGWGPSFGPQPAIQFPFYKAGSVVNVKHRSLDKQFRQEKGAEKCFYRFDAAVAAADAGEDTLYITEGEIDALSLQASGFTTAVSVPDGAPPTAAKDYRSKFDFLKSAEGLLARFQRVVLVVDADPPGKCLETELARRIGPEKCWRVVYPEGCKDANEMLVKHGREGVQQLIMHAEPYPIDGLYMAKDYRAEVLRLYEMGPNRGFSTGWLKVIDPLYSVHLGQVTIVTGIPGSGKSNFLDQLIVNMARQYGWGFALFSPENWPVERHIEGLLEKTIGKPFSRRGQILERMTQEDVAQGMEFINSHFYFVCPREDTLSVDAILDKVRIAIFRHGVSGVVIDPWNEVEHCFDGLTETQYISKQLSKIRLFARKNAVHIWVVAHPRNLQKDKINGGYHPPTPYEISGGANWRNKADACLCVHRQDFFNRDITEVIVQKIRFREVGRLGKAELRFCRDTGQYFE